MSDYLRNIVFLLICVLSRMVSAMYYIEDPDSLRFALCIYDQFDLMLQQPNFPGYPIFCFVAKIIYFFLGNFSIVFSIIGGISIYFLIISTQKILKVPPLSLEGSLIAIFLFFNPMIWLMSNKYLPDLAGTAVMIASFAYLVPESYKDKDVFKGWFLLGILGGLKLSYIPFLIIPGIYAFFVKKKYLHSLLSLALGVLFWLVPMVMDTDENNLLQIAQLQTHGHFYDFGGTVFTESDYWLRTVRFIQSIWADGLGGFWVGRNPALIFHSIGILCCLVFGLLIILSFGYPKSKIFIVLGSIFIYSLWIFFFQDIIYNSNHVLPLIPLILILISYGVIYFLVNYNYMYVKVFALSFLLGNVIITVVLAVQHTEPTAIVRVKEYIVNNKNTMGETTIVSITSINEFLATQKVNANFISVDQDSLGYYRDKINAINSGKLIVVGNLSLLVNKKPYNVAHFQHNPYVNRVWPDIYVYEYYLSDKIEQ